MHKILILAFLCLYSLGVAWRKLLSDPEAGQLLGHRLPELGVRHRVHDGVDAARSLGYNKEQSTVW